MEENYRNVVAVVVMVVVEENNRYVVGEKNKKVVVVEENNWILWPENLYKCATFHLFLSLHSSSEDLTWVGSVLSAKNPILKYNMITTTSTKQAQIFNGKKIPISQNNITKPPSTLRFIFSSPIFLDPKKTTQQRWINR